MVAKGVTCYVFCYKSLAQGGCASVRALNLRIPALMGVSAYVMPIAPVGLRRMRELRNCHFSGNFVTEAAHYLGAAETVSRRVLYCCHLSPPSRKPAVRRQPYPNLSNSRHCHTAALAKKILQKDFLRRGAASVSGVPFSKTERSHTALRRDDVSSKRIS